MQPTLKRKEIKLHPLKGVVSRNLCTCFKTTTLRLGDAVIVLNVCLFDARTLTEAEASSSETNMDANYRESF